MSIKLIYDYDYRSDYEWIDGWIDEGVLLNTAYNTYKVFSSNKIDEIQNISIKNEETDTLNLNMANELSEKVNIYNNSSSKINNNNTMNAMMELSDIEKREKKLHLILWATLIISGVIIVLNIKK